MGMFEFAENTKNMTAIEVLNYYRNCYYAEPQVTERGIVANAINNVLPNMVEVVRCKDCKAYDKEVGYCEAMGFTCEANDFCSYGERKDNEC